MESRPVRWSPLGTRPRPGAARAGQKTSVVEVGCGQPVAKDGGGDDLAASVCGVDGCR